MIGELSFLSLLFSLSGRRPTRYKGHRNGWRWTVYPAPPETEERQGAARAGRAGRAQSLWRGGISPPSGQQRGQRAERTIRSCHRRGRLREWRGKRVGASCQVSRRLHAAASRQLRGDNRYAGTFWTLCRLLGRVERNVDDCGASCARPALRKTELTAAALTLLRFPHRDSVVFFFLFCSLKEGGRTVQVYDGRWGPFGKDPHLVLIAA